MHSANDCSEWGALRTSATRLCTFEKCLTTHLTNDAQIFGGLFEKTKKSVKTTVTTFFTNFWANLCFNLWSNCSGCFNQSNSILTWALRGDRPMRWLIPGAKAVFVKRLFCCWLGHLKMSFYYPSSHKGREVVYFLYFNLWSYLCQPLLKKWWLWGTITSLSTPNAKRLCLWKKWVLLLALSWVHSYPISLLLFDNPKVFAQIFFAKIAFLWFCDYFLKMQALQSIQ